MRERCSTAGRRHREVVRGTVVALALAATAALGTAGAAAGQAGPYGADRVFDGFDRSSYGIPPGSSRASSRSAPTIDPGPAGSISASGPRRSPSARTEA